MVCFATFKFGGPCSYYLKFNSQNTGISLKVIHFIDKLKLILISRVRNSTANLTLGSTPHYLPAALKIQKQYLRWCLMASRSFLNFCRDSRSFTARHSLKIRLVKRISLKSKAAWSFLFEVIWVWNKKIINVV